MSKQKQEDRTSRLIFGSVLAVIALAVLVLACAVVGRVFRTNQIVRDGGAAGLSPTERFYLQTYLTSRLDDLDGSAGSNMAPVIFRINPGEGASQIALNLQAQGLLSDPELFLNFARYYGYDGQLEAGEFTVNPQITVRELAVLLTDAAAQEEWVTFIEGWRLEEMAQHLRDNPVASVDPEEYLALVRQERPLFRLGEYDFLASLGAGQTLEGYLFPDTYRLKPEATAADLVYLQLDTFGRRITPAMRQAYGTQGVSLRDAVTLASIVQREAVLDAERPVMAGVFYNRLAQGIPLQADPTVQYAVGYWVEGNSWWKRPLWQTDLDFDSPYNTYLYDGIPPGPIANPGLSALEAVAFPETTDYIFFVVDCTASAPYTHAFNVTYEAHLAKVEACR